MSETIEQEALQLKPMLENRGACKLSHTFLMEKLFNYSPFVTYCSEAMLSYNHFCH